MKTSSLLPKPLEATVGEIAEIAGYLWDRGWAECNAGNVSVDVTDIISPSSRSVRLPAAVTLATPVPELAGHLFLVSATGSRMRHVARTPQRYLGLLQIGEKGKSYRTLWQPAQGFAPTSELKSHLRIHQSIARRKGGARAVLHTHPESLIALSQIAEFRDEWRLNTVLWGMHPEATLVVPSGVGVVPYVLTGTEQLAVDVVRALETHAVALCEKHGCFAVAPTVEGAFDAIDTLEKCARIYLAVKSTGRTPEGLNNDQLAELRKAFAAAP